MGRVLSLCCSVTLCFTAVHLVESEWEGPERSRGGRPLEVGTADSHLCPYILWFRGEFLQELQPRVWSLHPQVSEIPIEFPPSSGYLRISRFPQVLLVPSGTLGSPGSTGSLRYSWFSRFPQVIYIPSGSPSSPCFLRCSWSSGSLRLSLFSRLPHVLLVLQVPLRLTTFPQVLFFFCVPSGIPGSPGCLRHSRFFRFPQVFSGY